MDPVFVGLPFHCVIEIDWSLSSGSGDLVCEDLAIGTARSSRA